MPSAASPAPTARADDAAARDRRPWARRRRARMSPTSPARPRRTSRGRRPHRGQPAALHRPAARTSLARIPAMPAWPGLGSLAAAREVTTRTSRNPPACPLVAVRTRFTPGSTFRYVADGPDTTGAGSVPGHHSARLAAPSEISAAAEVPPAEKLTLSPGTATADSRPPDSRSRVSTGIQPAFVRTRTGRTDELDTSSPSGSAVTCDDAVVSELTTIALPVALAFVVAAASAASCAEAAREARELPRGPGTGRMLPPVADLDRRRRRR